MAQPAQDERVRITSGDDAGKIGVVRKHLPGYVVVAMGNTVRAIRTGDVASAA